MHAQYYRTRLEEIFGGRLWILAIDALAGATALVQQLGALGAERCLCLATSVGAGPLPDRELAPDPILIEVEAPDMMTGIRRSLDVFAQLPAGALERVEAFDPKRRARVLGTIFDDGRPVAGRRKYGARPEEWQRLEDKTKIDAFWEAANVPHAPFTITQVSPAALESARAQLDRGQGVAVAGDSREGFNGGATYLRWIRDPHEVAPAVEFFAAHCDRVRVMPFLEGIACSIHGIVFEDYTVTLRPCEMLVFRRPGTTELHYGRAATFWDPPEADRQAMRRVARRVGDHLRRTLGYRGAFTVDGVLTREGFLPTELNPRFGAALGVMTVKLDIPLLFLNLAVTEGEPIDWHPRKLEPWILESADRNRSGGGMALTPRKQTETQAIDLTWAGDEFRVANAGEEIDARAVLGPAAVGGFLKVDLVPERTPVGPSAAPRVAHALACLDAHFDLGIGPLEPARDASN